MFYNAEHYADPTAGAAEYRENRNARARARASSKRREKPMHNKIFAIDPGTTHSGYVIVEHDGREITRVLSRGKLPNEELLRQLPYNVGSAEIVVEMVASYGMAVGREVFETCVWIGRFLQLGAVLPERQPRHIVYRMEEKQALCHNSRAKDANIVQALVDRYACGQPNHGKGTKASPGFFYGFSKDAWQAMAVAATWLDRETNPKEGVSE